MAKQSADQQQDKALNTYWNAREAILSEDMWSEGNDHRLANLMKLTERIEAWYPGLKEARDRAHFKQITKERGSVIDLSVMQNPGPSSDLIRGFRTSRNLTLNLQSPCYSEPEELRNYRNRKDFSSHGFPELSQNIWDRIVDNMGYFTVKFPISAVGKGHLAAGAKHLWVFQRTPSSIDVRNNRPTDPEWAKGLAPGWQRRRMDNFNILVTGGLQDEDLVNDGWTDIIRKLLVIVQKDAAAGAPIDIGKTLELADFEKMEQIRARVDAIVADERTAAALKPYYRQFCKRPCFHDAYLQSFTRPNVTLVDTAGRGVERITPRGVVANGVEFELDCLVYASGFEVGTGFARRAGYDLVGRDARKLSEKWADGVTTLHGILVHGFPNCLILGTQQAGFTVNFPHRLDEQARHVAFVIRQARERGAHAIEVSPEAEREWVETVIRLSGMGRQFLEECTPGYYNNEGKPDQRSAQDGYYGAGPVQYFSVLRQWREGGAMPGLDIR